MTLPGNDQWPSHFSFSTITWVPFLLTVTDFHFTRFFTFAFLSFNSCSWTLDSCPCTVNFHLFWFKRNLKSMLPESLLLCSLSLRCVVIDSETSGDFVPDWLCFCQVQVGSGCRRLDINTTVMKANVDWLKVPLPPIYEGDAHQFFWCNWVDAFYFSSFRSFWKWSSQSVCGESLRMCDYSIYITRNTFSLAGLFLQFGGSYYQRQLAHEHET